MNSTAKGEEAPITTPWGLPDHATRISDAGVYLVETPSHGGLYLTQNALSYLPTSVRHCLLHGPEWAEEDCELPIVITILAPLIDMKDLSRSMGYRSYDDTYTKTEAMMSLMADQARKICRTYERYRPCARFLPRKQV